MTTMATSMQDLIKLSVKKFTIVYLRYSICYATMLVYDLCVKKESGITQEFLIDQTSWRLAGIFPT